MARIKIDYGIDLGTTNSSICRMEKGEPVIIRTDTLKETLPSCVSVNKKGGVKAGDGAYNTMKSDKRRATKNWTAEPSNTSVEFKRTMGTDTAYPSSNAGRQFTSEQLSAEVLKTLKSFVTDEDVRSVVITVPAKFTVGQKTATIQAAGLAGFDHCELLQEPVAAAFAYGLSAERKNGRWMVFDFGGGTFDAALLKVKEGILHVFDTAGDNYLGGKDLDMAIVDKIIIPHLAGNYSISGILADKERNIVFREAMKTYAEEAKCQLSFKDREDILSNLGDLGTDDDGEEIELDISLSQAQVFEAMRPVFQKAIDICKNLLERNGLSGSEIDRLILIGGPTYSPLLRQMLKEQVTPNIDTSINPMTAVATGAALYASTINAEVSAPMPKTGEIELEVDYQATSVLTREWLTVRLASAGPESVQVEVVRADNAWSSGKCRIGHQGDVIDLLLAEGRANTFLISCYDERGARIPCSPAEVTIIQGSKIGYLPLPYNIGIAIHNLEKNKLVFRGAKGLEKNKPLPAVGVINGLRTSSPLRPGIADDILTIPVYQCEDDDAVERTAMLYEYVADIVVTGEEVKSFVPENSLVDVTITVDNSEQMTMGIFFLANDFTITKVLDTSRKQSVHDAEIEIGRLMHDARQALQRLEEIGIETQKLKEILEEQYEYGKNNPEKKAVLQHLKKIFRRIEEKDAETEWIRMEKKIGELFELLEENYRQPDSTISEDTFEQLLVRRKQLLLSKNADQAKAYYEHLEALYVKHNLLAICVSGIHYYEANFGEIEWKDTKRALYLVRLGKKMISRNPDKDQLRQIIGQIQELIVNDNGSMPFFH